MKNWVYRVVSPCKQYGNLPRPWLVHANCRHQWQCTTTGHMALLTISAQNCRVYMMNQCNLCRPCQIDEAWVQVQRCHEQVGAMWKIDLSALRMDHVDPAGMIGCVQMTLFVQKIKNEDCQVLLRHSDHHCRYQVHQRPQ